ELRALVEETHRLRDLLLADEDALDAAAADGDRLLPGERRVEAVGDRAVLDVDGSSRCERRVQRRRPFRLDGDDTAVEGRRDPGHEPATADRDDDRADVGGVFLDL